jgi:hypothetical protein
MAFPVKQVRTLEEQVRIIEEVEKTSSEKRIDVAKRLGLPPSTLNTIIVKKKEIRKHATCSVWCVEEMCGELGGGSCMGEVQGGGGGGDDDDEAKPEPVPSFTEALNAFESMRVFMYAHITKRDQANIVSIESCYLI